MVLGNYEFDIFMENVGEVKNVVHTLLESRTQEIMDSIADL